MGRTKTITNKQIIEAAREVFLSEGYGASTVEIAKKAGISEGSIYKRFSTKEKLFFAAMGIGETPRWVIELDKLSGKGDLKENLITISLQIIEFFSEMMPRMMVLRSKGNVPSMKLHYGDKAPPFRFLRALTRFFEREQDLGRIHHCDPKIPAYMLLGSLMNHVFLEQMGEHSDIEIDTPDYVRGLIDILWQGMAPMETRNDE